MITTQNSMGLLVTESSLSRGRSCGASVAINCNALEIVGFMSKMLEDGP